MFDAKSILETMITGGRGGSGSGQGGGLGGLGDILGQVMKQNGGQGGGTGQGGGMPAGLEDLVRNMMGGNASPQAGGNPQAPAATERSGQGDGGFGGFGDMMKDVLGGGAEQSGSGGKSGGGIGDILGQAFGQAKDGVRDGAGKINDATGAGDAMGDLMRQFSGKSPEEMMSQLQDLIANNKLGAGAALGGLGALVLGTSTGRSVAMSAAKIGALALIGGLAYKAYNNYQAGAPAGSSGDVEAEAAPQGSGFEPDAVSNDDAALYIRTMLAAAAADGRVDADEQQRIIGSLEQAGLDDGAEEFIANALNNPISIDEIASQVGSKEQAVQVYTAARIAIDPDTYGEKAFLSDLAARLGIEPELASHINAAAKGVATS
ncbi:MAG: tellurite resistance TerB family protein [Pseudomonadota bacterium]